MFRNVALLALVALAAGAWGQVAALKGDEVIEFFQTTAWLDEAAGVWHVPIHGWIYEPQDSRARKAIIAKVLEKKYGLKASDSTAGNFARRINLMIADNERGKIVEISMHGRVVRTPKSGKNGHIETILDFPADEMAAAAKNGVLKYHAMAGKEQRRYAGQVRLVGPEGLSVISDVDDTIKISHVTDRRRLFDYTFFRDFEAVPGMAERYRTWADQGAAIHFVSSSPWQLYAPLSEFAAAAGFPSQAFNLKNVRFRDRSFFNLFKEGTETKPAQIEPILERYRQRKFVLVGDSGEQDPEVYAALMRKYPEQVLCIYIRNVTGATADDARMSGVFAGLPAHRWRLFTDPATLALPTL